MLRSLCCLESKLYAYDLSITILVYSLVTMCYAIGSVCDNSFVSVIFAAPVYGRLASFEHLFVCQCNQSMSSNGTAKCRNFQKGTVDGELL